MQSIFDYLKDWRTVAVVLVTIAAFVAYRMQLDDREREGYQRGVAERDLAWNAQLAKADSSYSVQVFHLVSELQRLQGQHQQDLFSIGLWKGKVDSVRSLFAGRPVAKDTMANYTAQPATFTADSNLIRTFPGVLELLYLPTSHDWFWDWRATLAWDSTVVRTAKYITTPPLPAGWSFDPWSFMVGGALLVIYLIVHAL